MKLTNAFIAFLEAAGVVIYVILFAVTVENVPQWFGFVRATQIQSIILFLLTFVTSALICGSLILGYPCVLFFEGKKSAAIRVVMLSGFWLIVFLAVFAGTIILF